MQQRHPSACHSYTCSPARREHFLQTAPECGTAAHRRPSAMPMIPQWHGACVAYAPATCCLWHVAVCTARHAWHMLCAPRGTCGGRSACHCLPACLPAWHVVCVAYAACATWHVYFTPCVPSSMCPACGRWDLWYGLRVPSGMREMLFVVQYTPLLHRTFLNRQKGGRPNSWGLKTEQVTKLGQWDSGWPTTASQKPPAVGLQPAVQDVCVP